MIFTITCIILFLIAGLVENITASKVHSQLISLHDDVDFESVKNAVKYGNHLTKDIEGADLNILKRLRFIKVCIFMLFLVSFWI